MTCRSDIVTFEASFRRPSWRPPRRSRELCHRQPGTAKVVVRIGWECGIDPMEDGAMRFLNLIGNKFFAVALSAVLEQRLTDTLCGTKVLFRRDYERIAAARGFFGDFDPFGDFDLLFGAAKQNLKIMELPIRYRARTYGETKISRFREGAILGRMTLHAFRKFKS